MRTPFETLAVGVLSAVIVFPATAAVTELPAITVTGKATPSGDAVNRDLAQRSPDIHWPPGLSLKWSELFAHNAIEINAPCATVWNYLVQAQSWPQWYPNTGKVKIQGHSQILLKNTRFTWRAFDVSLDNVRFEAVTRLDSQVVEYVPQSRITGSVMRARLFGDLFVIPTIHGSLPQPVLINAL
jgi:hypothetical protein